MKTLHLSIIAGTGISMLVLIGIVSLLGNQTFAYHADSSLATINVNIDKSNPGKPQIVITGTVYKLFSDTIVLVISDPFDQKIAISQMTPNRDGHFSQVFLTIGPLWSKSGNYTVSVASSSQQLVETKFYYNGTKPCCISSVNNTLHLTPPLRQFKTGIAPEGVTCKEGLQLIIKSEDGSPACVKLDTAYMLIKRGWAYSESAYPEGDAQFALRTNSTIIPGHLPRHSGLKIPYQESSRIINYTGFDGVYNVTLMFRGTPQDYVLKPGTNGTITFEIDAKASESSGRSYPIPLPKSLNLTNYAVFYHEITSLGDLSKYPGVTFNGDSGFTACFARPGGGGTCIGGPLGGKTPIEAYVVDHPGVNVLFEPPSEVLPLGTNTTSQVVTMMIAADNDAPRGTYLVELFPRGEFLLTVGNQPYHE